ncbi:MAG TPA: response regulator, partial [Bacteroidales bacterium]|nr:response regulator [Bacteroidales bacterium]
MKNAEYYRTTYRGQATNKKVLNAMKILIVDDERSIRNSLREILEFEKYKVEEAVDGEEALEKIKDTLYDLILCDIKMPKKDGVEVLEQGLLITDAPFIMISGHGNIETAVDALKKGAYDYIEKPLDLNRLLVAVRNALEKKDLVNETKILKKRVSNKYRMVGE